MLGLTRREARERFDEIIAFAELEEFLDLKLKNYSSGMSVRLAFSVAIQVDADVLLVDEVLAVGDAAFQQKCFEQFQRLKAAGKTIVFVTHDMGAVERFCDRAMLIERGKVIDDRRRRTTIARAYNELNFGRLVHDARGGTALRRPRGGRDRGGVVRDADGERVDGDRRRASRSCSRWRCASTRRSTSRSSRSRCATRSGTRSSPPRRTIAEVADRRASRRATWRSSASRWRTGSRPAATS